MSHISVTVSRTETCFNSTQIFVKQDIFKQIITHSSYRKQKGQS